MPLDRLDYWLCLHHPYLAGISKVTLLTLAATAVLLGAIAAFRRKDRALVFLHGGLFTVLLVYPVNLIQMLWSLHFTNANEPFVNFALAMHPFYMFGAFAHNYLQPIGCLVGLGGAVAALRRPGYLA